MRVKNLIYIMAMIVLPSAVCAQNYSKENVVGYWYNKNAKKLYRPGDTIRLKRTPPINITAMFDSCGTDSTIVDLWKYTNRDELISIVKYVNRETHKETEQKVLYFPCKVMVKDSLLEIPTRRFTKMYKVLKFEDGDFHLHFTEVIKKEEDKNEKGDGK